MRCFADGRSRSGSLSSSLGAGHAPACSSRVRSVSALNSTPSSTAMFVIQSQSRNTTTPPSVP